MKIFEIAATAAIVVATATGGAYMGAFGGQMFGGDNTTALPQPLTKTVALLPITVPIYAGGRRVGYCVIDTETTLPNNYPDQAYQVATAKVSDAALRDLSTVSDPRTAQADCLAKMDTQIGDAAVTKSEFFELDPGS